MVSACLQFIRKLHSMPAASPGGQVGRAGSGRGQSPGPRRSAPPLPPPTAHLHPLSTLSLYSPRTPESWAWGTTCPPVTPGALDPRAGAERAEARAGPRPWDTVGDSSLLSRVPALRLPLPTASPCLWAQSALVGTGVTGTGVLGRVHQSGRCCRRQPLMGLEPWPRAAGRKGQAASPDGRGQRLAAMALLPAALGQGQEPRPPWASWGCPGLQPLPSPGCSRDCGAGPVPGSRGVAPRSWGPLHCLHAQHSWLSGGTARPRMVGTTGWVVIRRSWVPCGCGTHFSWHSPSHPAETLPPRCPPPYLHLGSLPGAFPLPAACGVWGPLDSLPAAA